MPFMSHPEHGYHQATEAEVPEMVKNGWKLDIHPHDPSQKPIKEEPIAIEGNDATIQAQPAPRRVGRPPKADDKQFI